MKRLTILMALFVFGTGFAQSENFETGYIDILKKDIQTEAKMLVGENLEMTEEQAEFQAICLTIMIFQMKRQKHL